MAIRADRTLNAPEGAGSRQDAPGCTVDGCDRPTDGRDLCPAHRWRLLRHGDVLAAVPIGSRGRLAGTLGYRGAHDRVRAARGPASAHRCAACGDPARQWAYSGGDPDELAAPPGKYGDRLPYSADPARYVPLCVRCHNGSDSALRRVRQALAGGRTCTRCQEFRPLYEFRRHVSGCLLSWCKPCEATYKAEWKRRNRERLLDRRRRQYPDNVRPAVLLRRRLAQR